MPQKLARCLWFLPGFVGLSLLLFQLQPIEQTIGHDYYLALPRLLIGAAHFWQNGFSIQHYSPSLCGGLPLFADPQNTYFSLPQFFSFFWDPYFSCLLSIFFCSAFGYLGFYLLCRRVYSLEMEAAHLGSLMFILNGFAFAHLWVGHLTHHTFYLIPWVFYLLFVRENRQRTLPTASALSLLLSYLVYSGSLHICAILLVSGSLLIPYHLVSRGDTLKAFLRKTMYCVLLFVPTVSGKVYASLQYSRLFFIRPLDSTERPFWEAFLQFFWFIPSFTEPHENFHQLQFGAWEYVGFISKMTVPLIIVFIVLKRPIRKIPFFAFGALTLFWIAVGTGIAGNKSLPFISHYHNPIKLLAGFIVPILLISSRSLSVGFKKLQPRLPHLTLRIYLTLSALVLYEFLWLSNFFVDLKLGIGYQYDPSVYQVLKKHHGIPEVTEVVKLRGRDDRLIAEGKTSLTCYEPLFGYLHENFRAQLDIGPTEKIHDGSFNMTHPGCLLYPETLHCAPWDRIPETQTTEFKKFIAGDSSPWPVPKTQTLFLWMSFFSLLLSLFFVTLSLRTLSDAQKKNPKRKISLRH